MSEVRSYFPISKSTEVRRQMQQEGIDEPSLTILGPHQPLARLFDGGHRLRPWEDLSRSGLFLSSTSHILFQGLDVKVQPT